MMEKKTVKEDTKTNSKSLKIYKRTTLKLKKIHLIKFLSKLKATKENSKMSNSQT